MVEEPRAGTGPDGSLGFTEISSADPGGTRRFLERVFGWKFRSVEMPMGEYLSYVAPGGQGGGIRPARPTEQPSSLAYVRVRDLDDAERRVRAEGAAIVLARVDVPGMGAFFWFRLPGGALMACWQDLPASSKGSEDEGG